MRPLSVITIYQPWASLIAIGAKPFEFRGWVAPKFVWNKRIGIHAAARPMRAAEVEDLLARLARDDTWAGALQRDVATPFLQEILDGKTLPHGALLGTALLGIPTPTASLPAAPQSGAALDGATYAWPVSRFEPFDPPLAVKGGQGFWNWRPEEVAA